MGKWKNNTKKENGGGKTQTRDMGAGGMGFNNSLVSLNLSIYYTHKYVIYIYINKEKTK